ncbi:uncharacterized protein DUF1615 [Crenobacter luteus]|uniref:DUF1615 domain-containing protein n=1 Tax=Crenobacter luteus TaxID=1452487 RepID=A0A161SAA6_9NEIS|nr:DUF1615 domain-containing protein [Crenobacter luteus]KZE32663.1 hypothetical protein AVW16_09720 [Crenobacter luteus]TCP10849.1 uncharacterized protein DUF1615 [Crenobacter luteus]
MILSKRLCLPLAAALLAAACTTPQAVRPGVPAPLPGTESPTPLYPPGGEALPPVVPAAPPAAAPTVPPRRVMPYTSEREGRALLARVMPSGIADRRGWMEDIVDVFTGLKLPYSPENFCAAIAVIEQESSWQADPTVPGLPKIVWGKIAEKAEHYRLPMAAVRVALMKPSPTGESYTARIDRLRTEKEMNALYEDMAAEAGRIGLPAGKNPIRTGGPMQVSIEFAEAHARAWPYPFNKRGSWRDEVFTRRGGLYFGIANLLHYPAPYKEMRYRFADFNAGRYASRNAAFQAAVARLSGRELELDGDLLNYRDGVPSGGSTYRALGLLSRRTGLSDDAVLRDLKLEKSAAFGQSELYRRVFALADAAAGRALPREAMPQIDLKSPKITRKLTTEWFANRVDGRYQRCLARQ